MCVYAVAANNRAWMLHRALISLANTVDWGRHRLIISDNGSCDEAQLLYETMPALLPFEVIRNGGNIGTANAINKAWKHRRPGEHAVKMDEDVVIHQPGWVDWMEDVFDRDPSIGIVGLKRKDLMESPWAEDDWKSEVYMLPHERGQRWLVVEEVKHVIGTCQAYKSALLDKIGYLVQPAFYGFDDSLSACRARLAGYKSVFLHGFEIDHLDPGGDAYCKWKIAQADKYFPDYQTQVVLYESGIQPIYYSPEGIE